MNYRYFLIIILIPLVLNSCRKDFDLKNLDYENYNRVVGPEGGTIKFYANYNNDNQKEEIVSLTVPQGALDSLLVFNMYQYENYELTTLMDDGFAKFGSKLLYFVPFKESEGYHERGQNELNYHLSVNFKQPVTVRYKPLADYSDLAAKNWQEVELYYNYYKTTNRAYKVYKIKIPGIDVWGEANNIFVNWNRQGYADGYDPTDLSYIVNGRWTASDAWGTGETSLENWELVGSFIINTDEDLITFEINETDYIYVIARDIFISDFSFFTPHIPTFPAGLYVKRASFDGAYYNAYLSDNTVIVLDDNRIFQYRLTKDLSLNNYPNIAAEIVRNGYLLSDVKSVSLKVDYSETNKYEAFLNSGERLYFDDNSNLIGTYNSGQIILPKNITSYISTNFPRETVNNIIYDNSQGAQLYTIYLSSDIKVIFYGDIYYQTIYSRINSNQLPQRIRDYFTINYPGTIFSEINYKLGPEEDIYEIYLIGNKDFTFNATGNLKYFKFWDFPENDLPEAVKTALSYQLSMFTVSNIWYTHSGQGEFFKIFFVEGNIGPIVIAPNGSMGK